MKIWGEKSFLEPVKNVIEIRPRLNLRLHICRDCYVTTQNDGLLCLWRNRLFTNSGSITRRSLVQIQPRHQDKAKGSGYAPLHFLGSTIFRRSYLGEVEGGCLNVRETSPRSPTACLPGPARQSFFPRADLRGFQSGLSEHGYRLESLLGDADIHGVRVGAGIAPAPVSARSAHRAAGSAGHGEIIYLLVYLEEMHSKLQGRHGEENWVVHVEFPWTDTELIFSHYRPIESPA